MAGLGIVIPRTGPGTGPTIPVALHGNGVTGATHRYVPERLNLAAGASVASIPDLIGSASLGLIGAASAPSPVIAETGGQKYLEFTAGVSNKQMSTSVDIGAAFTFATVLRVTDASWVGLIADGYAIGVLGNGTWVLRGWTGTAVGSVAGPARTSDFVVLFGIGASAASRLALSSNAYVSADAGTITAPNPSDADKLIWGSSFAPTAGSKQNIVEQNIWPFALDATQRAAHVAAMKSKWTALLTT